MKTSEFDLLWKQYEPMLQAITEVFRPFVEIAVHDLKKGIIVALYHNISQRSIGDPSPIKELKVATEAFPDYFSPYYKTNWDGRLLKCTSITLRSKKDQPIGLICLNIDASFFQTGYDLLQSFLTIKDNAENPIEIYGNQCEEQVENLIKHYLEEKKLSFAHIDRNIKRELVQLLYRKGIFHFKNAAPFIAKKLKLSRATIYNHIKLCNK